GGTTRRCASVRDPAQRAPPLARRRTRAAARQPEPAATGGAQGLARHQTQPTGLALLFTQPGVQRRVPARTAGLLSDPERLLGAAGLRVARPGHSGRPPVAPLDRHGPRYAARHRPVADRIASTRLYISGGGALGRGAVRGRWLPGQSHLVILEVNRMNTALN